MVLAEYLSTHVQHLLDRMQLIGALNRSRTVVSVADCERLPTTNFPLRFGTLFDVRIPNAQDATKIQLARDVQDHSAESSATEFHRHDVDHVRVFTSCEKQMFVTHRGEGASNLLIHEIPRGLVHRDATGQGEPHTEVPGMDFDFIAQAKSTSTRVDSNALTERSLRFGVNESIRFQIEDHCGVRVDQRCQPDDESHPHSFAGHPFRYS
ncbi:hypothetical protein [Rhodococcus sp. 05-340-1]|uniref:hypothetical protein n=1 Tax=Rhodococcus sp. 05-340-1 TaxID=2022505 RepID=UPI0015C5D6A6|nr:hypothetical protein [Rhodococcus sp. 05-340-1]